MHNYYMHFAWKIWATGNNTSVYCAECCTCCSVCHRVIDKPKWQQRYNLFERCAVGRPVDDRRVSARLRFLLLSS